MSIDHLVLPIGTQYRSTLDSTSAEQRRVWDRIGAINLRVGKARRRFVQTAEGERFVTQWRAYAGPAADLRDGDALQVDAACYRVAGVVPQRDAAGVVSHLELDLEELREPLS